MYGLNTVVFKGVVLWNNLPNNFKEAKSLTEFKTVKTSFYLLALSVPKLYIFLPILSNFIYQFIYLLIGELSV